MSRSLVAKAPAIVPDMQSVRIGAGLGFYGDNWEPVVASIERGGMADVARFVAGEGRHGAF